MLSKLLPTRSFLHSTSWFPGGVPLAGLTHGKSCSAEVWSQDSMGNFVLSQLYNTLFNKDLYLVLDWSWLVLVGDWMQAHGSRNKDHSKNLWFLKHPLQHLSIHSKPSLVFLLVEA